ncbi:MAG: hypothetical protein ABI675_04255 [Chitinophagaceae bacterium]
MKAIVLHCEPGSRFHFGKYAPDDDTALNDSDDIMHSDTLFAALINTYQEVFGDAQELVNAFDEGHLSISSLLYCLQQNDQYTWLLPKPICFNLFASDDYKEFRDIRFISKGVWENLQLPSSLTDAKLYHYFGNTQTVLTGDEIKFPAEYNDGEKIKWLLDRVKLSRLNTLPKVKVRDTPEERGIYQLTVTEIADNSHLKIGLSVHLYFLTDDDNLSKEIAEKFFLVINMLPYTGIGAERSTIGKIERIEVVNDWKIGLENADTDLMSSVSLFSPLQNDLAKMKYYKTIMRGGRRLGRGDDEEKRFLKSVRMISEGAILHKDCEGCLADVSPGADKTYLRNGKPLGLPVRSQWIPKYEQ